MSDIAIRVNNLSKQYDIGRRQISYVTFREALLNSLAAPLRWMQGERTSSETFWALEGVSFEVKQSEAVGIIGRNGAGKSTLLKILSRITKPTKGRAELYGRVASLLEVGTGFHGELSGRDNIYLNGAILGMSRNEVARKFDEIVDFSEVEQFIDTPVKHYSSGMYVRLAFAVAAHLEPEILIVDEVLAVGDAEFQRKCLGKMGDVAASGRTVLFVSHNMPAVQKLCTHGILLDKGHIVKQGSIDQVIDEYITSRHSGTENNLSLADMPRQVKAFGEKVRFTQAHILGSDGKRRESNAVMFGEQFSILLEIDASEAVDEISALVYIESMVESRIVTLASELVGVFFKVEVGKPIQIQVRIEDLILRPGNYLLSFAMRRNRRPLDRLATVMQLEVTQVSAREELEETDLLGFVHAPGRWNLYKP